jgi:hypothetical protein
MGKYPRISRMTRISQANDVIDVCAQRGAPALICEICEIGG